MGPVRKRGVRGRSTSGVSLVTAVKEFGEAIKELTLRKNGRMACRYICVRVKAERMHPHVCGGASRGRPSGTVSRSRRSNEKQCRSCELYLGRRAEHEELMGCRDSTGMGEIDAGIVWRDAGELDVIAQDERGKERGERV